MTHDLCSLSATQLTSLYRAKLLSPAEVARAVLQRIDELNERLNAFSFIAPDVLGAAKASEARWAKGEPKGLLDGVPVSIKDLILTRGWPTLRGSKTVDPKGPWSDDAPAVARLREHGALLIGKTTTPEFGWKGVTDSPLTGITRNPWSPDKTPGGSSGGAAAGLAAGMGPLALGTDGGGSIRIPSSFTGVFGLKPSFGRVPAWPLSPFGTVAHVGPMARTVPDAALMLNVLSLPDARDWHALPFDPRDYRVGLEDGVRSLRQLQQTQFYLPDEYDQTIEVTNRESFDLCLRLNREECIIAGPSSGMALAGAVRTIPDEPGTIAVVIFPDNVFKYASSVQRHFPYVCPTGEKDNGKGPSKNDIFWVDTEIFDQFRPKASD